MEIYPKSRWNTRTGIILYLVITIGALVYGGMVFYYGGIEGLNVVLRETPGVPRMDVMVIYVLLAWLVLGSMLLLGHWRIINRENMVFWGAFYLYCFLYLNFLRERTTCGGDAYDYINAAFNLYHGEALNLRYIYPPFWATCLQPFVPLGRDFLWILSLLVSYVSLVLLFPLLYLVLKRYGFHQYLAVGAVFVMLIVNVPIIRTVFFFQVNIHVLNLVLLSLLLYPGHIFWSALALCLAVQIKVSPILLVLPFLIGRQWKWLLYFLGVNLVIVLFTSLMNNPKYYLDCWSNLSRRALTEGFAYRDNSIDSFMRATFALFQIGVAKARYLTVFIKLGVLILSLGLFFKSFRQKVFYQGDRKQEIVYNGYIILMFAMLVLAPLIWEHHPVLIILPFLVLLRTLSDRRGLIMYGLAYVLIFIIPTFDFYPFSYHRLLGMVLCYVLLWKSMRPADNTGQWFGKINQGWQIKWQG